MKKIYFTDFFIYSEVDECIYMEYTIYVSVYKSLRINIFDNDRFLYIIFKLYLSVKLN